MPYQHTQQKEPDKAILKKNFEKQKKSSSLAVKIVEEIKKHREVLYGNRVKE